MVTFKQLHVTPPFFLKSAHLQTIIGSFGRSTEIPYSHQQFINLQDGDNLCCEVSQPPNWRKSDPTFVMIHGLGGSYRSLYLQRLVPRLLNERYRTVRVNLRGCGSGKGLAKRSYHGGNSRDILKVLKTLKKEFPLSEITLIGFSLGGNIILKLLGELGSAAQCLVSHAMGICPAVDLMNSAQLITLKQNRLYQDYFMKNLCQEVQQRHQHFPDLPNISIHRKMNLIEFDEKYTAVLWGFKGALDYYQECSSQKYVGEIRVPCDILYAHNDPVIDHATIKNAPWPKSTTLWCANTGGHMGFLSWSGKDYGYRWMDYQIMNIINSSLSN
jgi:uncharacterized protein